MATALWSLSKNINPSLVLVQPKKTRPDITERLLIGHKESNQNNTMAHHHFMPPTLKKLNGHIAFGLSVRALQI